jgi:tetratricopeptide (TPR) repeat protein
MASRNPKFTEQFKKMLKAKGLTQAELAKLMDYHPTYVSKLVNANPAIKAGREKLLEAVSRMEFPESDPEVTRLLDLADHIPEMKDLKIDYSVLRSARDLIARENLDPETKRLFLDEFSAVVERWQNYCEARVFLAEQTWPELISRCRKILTEVETQSKLETWTHQMLGEAYYHQGELNQADSHFRYALVRSSYTELSSNLRIRLGDIARAYGKWGEAVDHFETALSNYQEKIAEEPWAVKGVARAQRKIANVHLFNGEPKKAEPLLFKAEDNCKKVGDQPGLAKIYYHLGWAYDLMGDLKRSLDYRQEGLRIAREAGDIETVQQGYRFLGDFYRSVGNWSEAKDNYDEALILARDRDDPLERGMINLGLAIVFHQLSKADPSLSAKVNDYFSKSLEAHTRIQNYFWIGLTLSYRGMFYAARGNFDRAIRDCRTAFSYFDGVKNNYYKLAALVNECDIRFLRGDDKDYAAILEIIVEAKDMQPDKSKALKHFVRLDFFESAAMIMRIIRNEVSGAKSDIPEDVFKSWETSYTDALSYNMSLVSEVQGKVKSVIVALHQGRRVEQALLLVDYICNFLEREPELETQLEEMHKIRSEYSGYIESPPSN